jgi:hypothetical protein
MTALSAPRATPTLETGYNVFRTFDVAADAIIYPGAMVALDATGYLVPASADATLRVVGIASPSPQQIRATPLKGYIDATGLDDGDVECEVHGPVIALMANSGSSVTIADVGNSCYAADDATVSKTDGGTAQVTRGDVEFNGTDLVGLTVDGITVSVASDTDDDTTATALMNKWNGHVLAKQIATASVDLSGAPSYIILTFKDSQAHTVTSYSPAAADITSITNTTASVAGARPRAGKVHLVDDRGVWVAID